MVENSGSQLYVEQTMVHNHHRNGLSTYNTYFFRAARVRNEHVRACRYLRSLVAELLRQLQSSYGGGAAPAVVELRRSPDTTTTIPFSSTS
ncbi:unnamed protein product [Boreogadus saida]